MPHMGFEGRTVHFDWHNQRPVAFGYQFKSKQEYRWAKYLELQAMSNLRSGEAGIIGWRYEPKIFEAKKIRWNKLRTYTPDFAVSIQPEKTGGRIQVEWQEVKTSLRQKDVTRFKWFRADYPDERIILVLNSMPQGKTAKSREQLIRLGNAKKYVDDVIIAGPILRKLGI